MKRKDLSRILDQLTSTQPGYLDQTLRGRLESLHQKLEEAVRTESHRTRNLEARINKLISLVEPKYSGPTLSSELKQNLAEMAALTNAVSKLRADLQTLRQAQHEEALKQQELRQLLLAYASEQTHILKALERTLVPEDADPAIKTIQADLADLRRDSQLGLEEVKLLLNTLRLDKHKESFSSQPAQAKETPHTAYMREES